MLQAVIISIATKPNTHPPIRFLVVYKPNPNLNMYAQTPLPGILLASNQSLVYPITQSQKPNPLSHNTAHPELLLLPQPFLGTLKFMLDRFPFLDKAPTSWRPP